MASTAETNLKLELMADGENENTWGQKTNTNLSLLANAIAKKTPLTLGGSPVSLSDTSFADSQARALALDLTGTLSATVAITIPGRSKMYIVRNATTGSFSVTVGAAGTAAIVPQNATSIIWCDGTNTTLIASNAAAGAIDATTLAGVAANLYARLDVSQSWSKGQAVSFVTAVDGATVTVDCTLSNKFICTLAGNRTIDLASMKDGQEIELWLVQDATGSRTVTWPVSVLFANGITPTMSTDPAAIDVFRMTYNLGLNKWVAVGLVGGAATSLSATFSVNESNVNLWRRVGSPSGVVTLNVVIGEGVVFTSTSNAEPAFDMVGFASGSTINITNLGYAIGRGGDGDPGTWCVDDGNADFGGSTVGNKAGGNAMRGPGSGITVNITNLNGHIWGGGGGGGGGGSRADTDNDGGLGGGGGGGAGCGIGGPGVGLASNTLSVTSARGTNGILGLDGSAAYGTGGAGAEFDDGSYGAGGNGGDYGAAGSTGGTVTATGNYVPPTAGGAAGKAIDLNGGTVNFLSGSGSPNVKGAVS